jgi:hypothetical protein
MAMLVLDPYVQDWFLRVRRERGHDRWDEVWDGIYLVMPSHNVEQQHIVGLLTTVFWIIIHSPMVGNVYAVST